MDRTTELRAHTAAVTLWRRSLNRWLDPAERDSYNRAMAYLHPLMRHGFAEQHLGRGIDFEAQRKKWRAYKAGRPKKTGRVYYTCPVCGGGHSRAEHERRMRAP